MDLVDFNREFTGSNRDPSQMNTNKQDGPWRVLIASSHPLFAKGLRGLLQKRQEADVVVVGIVATIDEAMQALQSLHPDLVIVDYDDERVNRDEFLARFVEGEGSLRVVLLSLKEGGNEAIVYDRRSMAASQIEDWLEKWTDLEGAGGSPGEHNRVVIDNGSKPTRRNSMKHIIAAALVVIVLSVVSIFALTQIRLLPTQASLQAVPIDDLFQIHFIAIAVLFSLIVGFMLYSIVVFRRRKGDTSDGVHMEGSTSLEVTWTIVPLATVLVVSFIGAGTLSETVRADPQPVEVNVIGQQWSWRFEYPEYDIRSTDLVLPVNKQALLHMSSIDVIHSFWVPEFRVKQDALPGGDEMIRDIRITPSQEGEYKVRCAELCGQAHATMLAPVVVMSQVDFDAWVNEQLNAVSDDPVERGMVWAQQFGCTACHSADGTTIVGPSWLGIFGEETELADGSTVTVDQEYIRESILNPGAKIVAGFDNVMPADVGAELTESQIDDIIAYIESLQ